MQADPCIKCGGTITQMEIDQKQRIAAKLYPGRPCPPPKVCAPCVWKTLCDMDGDELQGNGPTGQENDR